MPTVSNQGDEQMDTPRERTPAELREQVRVAVDEGYFDVPRETSLVELSEKLDVPDHVLLRELSLGVRELVRERRDDS